MPPFSMNNKLPGINVTGVGGGGGEGGGANKGGSTKNERIIKDSAWIK